jgi:hypothetical protein
MSQESNSIISQFFRSYNFTSVTHIIFENKPLSGVASPFKPFAMLGMNVKIINMKSKVLQDVDAFPVDFPQTPNHAFLASR